ncbi:MAG: FtsX-like permease family protein [Alphaproteobacteria bacterium]
MNSLTLSLAYLRHKLLGTFLNLITFASGIAMIVALLSINAQLDNELTKNLEGIDLVVGGKGSPMQLILSSVLYLDIPTGNIPLEEAKKLERHPMVKTAIPVALGDNYNGFRIVGTNDGYISHYNGQLTEGKIFTQQMEVVLGSAIEAKYHHKLGDQIIGAHGLIDSDDLHTDFPYTVVGILKPTGTVLDRLVLTPVESVWHVHEHPDEDDPEEVAYKKEHPGKELTALLLAYKTPIAAASLPREINKSTSMQAASPAFEVARLTSFIGVGADTLRIFGWFLISLAGSGIFVALYNAMEERRYTLALMRSFGASPGKLFGLVTIESLVLALSGTVLGILLGHIFVQFVAIQLSETKHIPLTGMVFLPEEGWLLVASVVIGISAALLPALRAYRIDIFKTLVQR